MTEIPTASSWLVIWHTGPRRWAKPYSRLGDAKRFIARLKRDESATSPWKKPIPDEDIFLFDLSSVTPLPHDHSTDPPRQRRPRGRAVDPASVVDFIARLTPAGEQLPTYKEVAAEYGFRHDSVREALMLIRSGDDPRFRFRDPRNPKRAPIIRTDIQ